MGEIEEDQEDRERISEGGVAHFSSTTLVFGEATPRRASVDTQNRPLVDV
jgi:hypothetical protein